MCEKKNIFIGFETVRRINSVIQEKLNRSEGMKDLIITAVTSKQFQNTYDLAKIIDHIHTISPSFYSNNI